jgi:prepilin-type N-terminal cleavage/methylation domain-containing protein
MKRRAFSLIEVLICIAIIAIVAAIAFPVFARAKQSAKESKTISNLHQLGVLVSLYREDYGGGANTGSPADMALPPGQTFFDLREKYAGGLKAPQRGPMFPFFDYFYYIPGPGGNAWDNWAAYSESVDGQVILAADFTFNSKYDMDMLAFPKLGFGVFIDTSVKTRRKAEMPLLPTWWHDR